MTRAIFKNRTALTRFRSVVTSPGNPGEYVYHDWIGSRNLTHLVHSTSKAEYRASVETQGVAPFNVAVSEDPGEYEGEAIRTPHGTPVQNFRLVNGPVIADLITLSLPPDAFDQLARDALTKAMDKAAAWRAETSVGVDVGESPKSMAMAVKRMPSMISAMAKSVTPTGAMATAMGAAGALAEMIFKDYQSYRKRGKKFPRRRRKPLPDSAATVSSWWLEARLGWGPLVGSLDNALKELAANRNAGYVHQFVGRQSLTLTREWAGMINQPMGPEAWKSSGTETQELKARASVFVAYKFAPTRQADYVGSPFDVAWELVPLSFVVDRFVHIGNFLKREAALADSIRVRVGLVKEAELRRVVTPVSDSMATATGKFVKTSKSYSRDLWPTAPRHPPPLNRGLGTFTNGAHLADYVALLTGLVRKDRSPRTVKTIE